MGSTHRSHYSQDQRHIALGLLLSKANGEIKLPHGALTEVSKETGIHQNSLKTIWERKLKGENIGIRRSDGHKKRKHIKKDIIRNKLTMISLLKEGLLDP